MYLDARGRWDWTSYYAALGIAAPMPRTAVEREAEREASDAALAERLGRKLGCDPGDGPGEVRGGTGTVLGGGLTPNDEETTMDPTTLPRRISPQWLRTRRQALDYTARELADGSPNPARAELEAEVAEATAEMARRDEFERWARQRLGMAPNQYPVRTAAGSYEPGRAFVRKDRATGRLDVLSAEEIWERYLAR